MTITLIFLLIGFVFLFNCSPVEKPNVILFLIDDYGYGDISAEGNTQVKTPNIDRIADQGARFSQFYQCSGACAPVAICGGGFLFGACQLQDAQKGEANTSPDAGTD